MYEGIETIYQNALNISRWAKADDFDIPYLYHADIPLLDLHSIEFLSKVFTNEGWKVGFRKVMEEYLNAAEQINRELQRFSEVRDRSVTEWEGIKAEIREFLAKIVSTVDYQFVVAMPNRNQVSNITILARDPW